MCDEAFEPAVIRVLNPDTMRLEPLIPNLAVCFISYFGSEDNRGRPALRPKPDMEFATVHHLAPDEVDMSVDEYLDLPYGLWLAEAFEDPNDPSINVPGRLNTGSSNSDPVNGDYRSVDPRFQPSMSDAVAHPVLDGETGYAPGDYINGNWEQIEPDIVVGSTHELSAIEDWGYRGLHSAGAIYVQHPVNGKLYPMMPNNLVAFLTCDVGGYRLEKMVAVYSLSEEEQRDLAQKDVLAWFENQKLPVLLHDVYGGEPGKPNGDNTEISTGVWYSTMERFLPRLYGR